MRDDLRRMALFTSGLAEMTRHRAEELVRSWARSGDTTREQAAAMAHDLVEWSRQNRKEMTRFVRSEIETQMASLGLASKRDLDQLERRVERLQAAISKLSQDTARTPRRTTGQKKTTRKKATTKPTRRRSAANTRTSG